MSDKIKRVTPRDISDMLANEQAYQSTLFVAAADHDGELSRLRTTIRLLANSLEVYANAHSSGDNVPRHVQAAARIVLKEAGA
jgi:hypothetical protein